jgi:hypothetical protein
VVLPHTCPGGRCQGIFEFFSLVFSVAELVLQWSHGKTVEKFALFREIRVQKKAI